MTRCMLIVAVWVHLLSVVVEFCLFSLVFCSIAFELVRWAEYGFSSVSLVVCILCVCTVTKYYMLVCCAAHIELS